jgi:ubiquinol oxidase
MSSRMAGSAILRHVGGVRLFTASATSPAAAAAAAARPFLAGGEAVPGVWGLRLMSTSSVASTEAAAKAEAKKADAEKEVVVNSYWGIEQSKKLVREDGTEWKWSCFRVLALRFAPDRFPVSILFVP